MLYPYDPSGTAAKNLVVAEVHAVSPPKNINDASLIVPRMTPFFKAGVIVMFGTRPLIEGVDYILVFHHLSLSTHLTKPVFGGISFRNRDFTGTVKLTYQVVGGDFQLGDLEILEKLARRLGHFQYITFDQIVGTPSTFPPEDHYHDLERDVVDMGDVVDVLEQMSTNIGKNPGSIGELSTRLNQHMNQGLAHTKAQVGLENVENLRTATLAQVKTGTFRGFVTSDVLFQYVSAGLGGGSDKDMTALKILVDSEVLRLNALYLQFAQQATLLTNMGTNISAIKTTADGAKTTAADALAKATAALAKANSIVIPPSSTGGLSTAQVNTLITQQLSGYVANDARIPGIQQQLSTISQQITAINTRIDKLPAGGGSTSGQLVSKIQVGISSKSQWFNSGTVTSTATITLKELLPMTLVSTSSTVNSSGTTFVVNLPTTYNATLHRVVVSGGGYSLDNAAKTVRVTAPASRSEQYGYEVGDETRTGTRYYCTGSFTVEVLTK